MRKDEKIPAIIQQGRAPKNDKASSDSLVVHDYMNWKLHESFCG